MLFNSFTFAAFFSILYALYLLTARRLRIQNTLLLVGSYVFYGCWDWRFLGLILLSTLIDFSCGWALDRRSCSIQRSTNDDLDPPYLHTARTRRVILCFSVIANLGLLGFFKYHDFFAASGAIFFSAIGLPLEPRLLHLVLPVGISFYTFQTLSYTVDIYRGHIRAHRSLLDFAVFVAFFPQLVAGPIMRARDLIPQIASRRRLCLERFYEGGYLILWGLFKKVVIADNLAILVDRIFATDPTPIGAVVWVALYAFAFQIYCDFSGYTDIARGCSKMLGFELCVNFNLPYFATNPADFWRRWHISLSTWLRDYVYIPLGGNRKGPRRTGINLLLTMALGGLWHGAAWTFVLWGIYQGVLLLIHRWTHPWTVRVTSSWSTRQRAVGRWLAVLVFFHFVCIGWLIFRAESVGQVGHMLASLCTAWPWWIMSGASRVPAGLMTLTVFVLPLLVIQIAQYAYRDSNVLLRLPAWARGLCYSAMLYALVLFGAPIERQFIYFQF